MAIHRFTLGTQTDLIAAGQRQPSFRSDVERKDTPLKQYDPESADMAFANRIAQEIIEISGAEVIVYPRTDNGSFDPTWEEDADPSYKAGKHLKAYFAPQPMKSELTPWGYDTSNQTTLVFCREEVYAVFGSRMIREDDLISIPYNSAIMHKRPDKYRVLNAFDFGNFKYNWLYFSCMVENITNDSNQDVNHK